QPRRRLRHPDDGRPLLHRPWSAAAAAGMGSDGGDRQRLHPGPMVVRDLSGAGDLAGRDELQLARRRLAGSAVAGVAPALEPPVRIERPGTIRAATARSAMTR